MFEARYAPSSTGTTNQIKVIARLWKASKEWLAILLPFRVLLDHDLVHDVFENEQLRKSANAATICGGSPVSESSGEYEREVHGALPNASNFRGDSPLEEVIV